MFSRVVGAAGVAFFGLGSFGSFTDAAHGHAFPSSRQPLPALANPSFHRSWHRPLHASMAFEAVDLRSADRCLGHPAAAIAATLPDSAPPPSSRARSRSARRACSAQPSCALGSKGSEARAIGVRALPFLIVLLLDLQVLREASTRNRETP
jgi:hypothetical protein